MRSHRAFRQLTTLLTRGGYHVLRFDYGGTGDSAGEGEAQTLEQWTDDVSTAIEELRDTAGLDQVTVVGLRLGAALALQAAARGGSGGVGVDRLVLWDPVADGERWLAEVLPAGVEATARELSAPGGSGVVGVSGFPLPLALFQELRTLLPDGAGVPREHRWSWWCPGPTRCTTGWSGGSPVQGWR
jgi:pimeloyl-ACP methyl ester carboxylesterase